MFRINVGNWTELGARFEECIDENHNDIIGTEELDLLLDRGFVTVDDEATADNLKTAVEDCGAEDVTITPGVEPLGSSTHVVTGLVTGPSPDALPMSNIVVVAFEITSQAENRLSATTTESDGSYRIDYTPSTTESGLLVRAYAAEGSESPLATSPSIPAPEEVETVDLTVEGVSIPTESTPIGEFGNDIFRFVTIRPVDPEERNSALRLRVWHASDGNSELHTRLRTARENTGETSESQPDIAREFLSSERFVSDFTSLQIPLLEFASALGLDLSTSTPTLETPVTSRAEIARAIEATFDEPPSVLVESDAFETAANRLGDSVLAVTYAQEGEFSPGLLKGTQLLALLELVAKNDDVVPGSIDGIGAYLERPLVLPPALETPAEISRRSESVELNQESLSRVHDAETALSTRDATGGRSVKHPPETELQHVRDARVELTELHHYLSNTETDPASTAAVRLAETRVGIERLKPVVDDTAPSPQTSGARSERPSRPPAGTVLRDISNFLTDAQRALSESLDTTGPESDAGDGVLGDVAEFVDSFQAPSLDEESGEFRTRESGFSTQSPSRDRDSLLHHLPLGAGLIETLTPETQQVLTGLGLSDGSTSLVFAIDRLNDAEATALSRVYESRQSDGTEMVSVGTGLVPRWLLEGQLESDDTGEVNDSNRGILGNLLDLSEISTVGDQLEPRVHALGVGDLRVVRQQLARYELGEIAHIENVMRSEHRNREFRRLRRTEEERRDVEEVEEETERDVQTTERFELQREAERAIEQERESDAGVSISASYGPTVEVEASAGFGQRSAREEASRVAKSYGREITEQATTRVQNRIRTEHVERILEETEETTDHGFDNSGSDGDHISGIYRWVDKVYANQVYNYGERLMYEFIVPEPAAFYRDVQASSSADGTTLTKPTPPSYISLEAALNDPDPTPIPLKPEHLSESLYLGYARVFDLQDYPLPPERYRSLSRVYSKTTETPDRMTLDRMHLSENLEIPDGYQPVSVRITAHPSCVVYTIPHHALHIRGFERFGTSDFEQHLQMLPKQSSGYYSTVSVGPQQLGIPLTGGVSDPVEVSDLVPSSGTADHYELPVGISAELLRLESIDGIQVPEFGGFLYSIDIQLERTSELFSQWQQDMYDAIVEGYREQVAAYQSALANTPVDRFGSNPRTNRRTIEGELKRSMITLMQPQGGLIADAATDPDSTRFFERAFEWENMTYVFYPYFWADSDEWPVLVGTADDDPILSEFLTAGAARVVLSVRPGYEKRVQHFLTVSPTRPGTAPPHSDKLHRADYIPVNEDLGVADTERPDEEPVLEQTWENRLPTTLVKIQDSDALNAS